MKFERVIFAFFFFFVVLHLSFLMVNGSVIQRSLSDDIKNGISIAGKIFGIDSPSNIAAVSNIADLVARAFSNNNNNNFNNGPNRYNGYKQDGWHDKQMFEKRPMEKLESFSDDEIPFNQHHVSTEESIDDNVIVGNGYNTSPQTTLGDNGLFGQVLRILGMDSSKIGAMALNGIIFIAQMIGRSFMSAFTGTTKTQKIPNENILPETRHPSENYKTEQPRALPIIENVFDWILDQSKKKPFLLQQINAMLDKELPERILSYIDDGEDDKENGEMQTDCIKMLICKSVPIIQGMQRAVAKQINGKKSETIESDENSSNVNPNIADSFQLNAFFEHLPSVDEFRDYGEICENRFKSCKIF